MARLLSAGGEEYNAAGLWTTVALSGDTEVVYIEGDQRTAGNFWSPRTGWAMYRLPFGASLGKTFSPTLTEMYGGFAFKDGTPSGQFANFANYAGGSYTNSSWLSHIAGGYITCGYQNTTLATSALTMSTGAWHYIEFYYKPITVTGRWTIKVDGVTFIDFTGNTTMVSNFVSAMQLTGQGATTAVYYFDDVVINDTTGAANNSWPGQVRLLPILPRANGDSSTWARAGVDLGNNYQQVVNPTGAYSLVQQASANQDELYLMDVPTLPGGATITNVISQVKARVQAGTGSIDQLVKQGGTLTASADKTLTSGFTFLEQQYPVNPATGIAWTQADLATLQLGFRSK